MGKEKTLVPVEIDYREYGLEAKDAKNISEAFKPMLDKMVDMEGEFNQVMKDFKEKGITPEVMAASKELRLRFVKGRTTVDKIHKSQKKRARDFGLYVDGWKNTYLATSSGKEEQLADIEKHYENIAKEKIANLQQERALKLQEYEEPHVPENLGTMDENVWTHYLGNIKGGYDRRKKAEADAEAERLQKVEDERLENERIKKENEQLLKYQEKKRKDEEREKKKVEKLQNERAAQMENFTEFIPTTLGVMDIKEFEKLLQVTKKIHDEKEQEKKAEADREEREGKLQIKRSAELAKYEVENIPSFLGAMEEEVWKDALENAKVNLKARKDAEILEKQARKDREDKEKLEQEKKDREEKQAEEKQAELNKGDAEKVIDLVKDLEAIRDKYSFDSAKNKKMFSGVKADITSIIMNMED